MLDEHVAIFGRSDNVSTIALTRLLSATCVSEACLLFVFHFKNLFCTVTIYNIFLNFRLHFTVEPSSAKSSAETLQVN
jgi:hypothetical protein